MSYAPRQAPSINIVDVLRGVGRRRTLISSIILVALVAALVVVTVIKPVYTTEAQILVENMSTPYDRVSSVTDTRSDPIDDRTILSQVSVLSSGDLGIKVVQGLRLAERPDFNSLIEGMSPLKSVALALGFGEDPRLMTPEERALRRLESNLTIYQIPQSNVIAVKASAGDGATSAEIANTLAALYVATTREAQMSPTGRARDWLGSQIETLRSKIVKAEAEVETFRSSAGLLKGQTTTLGNQELSELNTQITLAGAARSEAEAKAAEIKALLASKGSVDASSEVLNSQIIQRLREQQVAAQRRVSELSATYLPNHPKMIAAQNDLSNVDRQIRREALKIVDGLEGQAKIAAAREDALRASLEELKGKESSANLDEVKLKAMERDVAADRQLLESMLSRYADANSRQIESAQPGFARIIQNASAPASPTFPKKGPMVLLITIAGVALALGLAFLLEVMAAAARLQQDAENSVPAGGHPARMALEPGLRMPDIIVIPESAKPGLQPRSVAESLPVIAEAPSLKTAASALDVIQMPDPDDRFGLAAASVKVMAAITGLRQNNNHKRFALISIGGGPADAGLLAVGVARLLSNQKSRVVVVDVSPDNSSDMLFGIPAGPGISDLVTGAADFTKIIARDPASNAHYVRYGMSRSAPASSAVRQKMDQILAPLANIYDVVIIHAGEADANTPNLVSGCNAAILLAPERRHRDANAAAATLTAKGLSTTLLVRLASADVKLVTLAETA